MDCSHILIERDRFILRPFSAEDIDDFYEYAKVEGVGELAGWPHHQSIEENKRIAQSFLKNKNILSIILKENHKMIGTIGVHDLEDETYLTEKFFPGKKLVHIGYVLSKEYWGKGLMTEVLNATLSTIFKNSSIELVVSGCFDENSRSRRVLEKNGFKKYHKIVLDTLVGKKPSRLFYLTRNEVL